MTAVAELSDRVRVVGIVSTVFTFFTAAVVTGAVIGHSWLPIIGEAAGLAVIGLVFLIVWGWTRG